jgi:hypothetical protein
MAFKLCMKTSMAGPSGFWEKGQYVSVETAAEARRMVAQGAAEAVDPIPAGTKEEQAAARRTAVETVNTVHGEDGELLTTIVQDARPAKKGRRFTLPPRLDEQGRPFKPSPPGLVEDDD